MLCLPCLHHSTPGSPVRVSQAEVLYFGRNTSQNHLHVLGCTASGLQIWLARRPDYVTDL